MLLLSIAIGQAQVFHVRPGATGANTGTDWNNAYATLPLKLMRGATYYLADGNYGRYVFNTPASGAKFIYIRKATAKEHGVDAGWQASYGDGQAVFGPMHHDVPDGGGYIDIDGKFEYGIKIDFSEGENGFTFTRGGTDIKFRYIDFDGISKAGDHEYKDATKCISWFNWTGFGHDRTKGVLVSHCALHGGESLMQDIANDGVVVEYCDFYDARAIGFFHANIYFSTGNNGTFRYNRVHNYIAEGLYFTYGQSNWKVYGNIFYDGAAAARGIEINEGFNNADIVIYNNTFVNLEAYGVWVRGTTSGSVARNNLAYNAGFNWGDMPEANNTVATFNPFVNLSSDDYRLVAPTAAGTILSQPYDVDMDEKRRGADGVWDRGAYEYTAP